MLPDDPDWHSDDGNEPITHDFVNAIQRSIDAAGSGGTLPAPTGTTLPWGGGRLVIAQNPAGVNDGLDWTIDSSLDYRNRQIVVLEFGAYNAANRLPGGGAEDNVQPGFDYLWDDAKRTLYTKSGATTGLTPTGGPYLVVCTAADDAMIFCDAATHVLAMRNETGATIYPFIVYFVSDQFPTRT